MGKYHYAIEPMRNRYAASGDYMQVFGFRVIDTYRNECVRTFLVHDWRVMLETFSFGKQTKAWVAGLVGEK